MISAWSFLDRLGLIGGTLAQLIRRDAGLYLIIAIYTLAGMSFLNALDAADRSAYSIYVVDWTKLNCLVFPIFAVIFDTGRIIHRFSARRGLAVKRTFSTNRLAYSLSGLCLLMALMVFQGTFTSVKNAMPVWQGGFQFDTVQADIDAFLHFGVDPWRWLHTVGANDWVRAAVEWNYNAFWFLLNFTILFFVATSPKAAPVRTRYLVCFMAVWVVVGNLLAVLFLSAGPAFYGQVTGDTARFGEQLAFLANGVGSPNSAVSYQNYLWSLYDAGQTGFASGISAFPSVHVGLVTLNALFLREYNRYLGALAFLYAAFVAASSVYLAWHYAIDGYVGAAVVLLIYLVARKLIPADRRLSALPGPAATINRPEAALAAT